MYVVRFEEFCKFQLRNWGTRSEFFIKVIRFPSKEHLGGTSTPKVV